MPTPLDCAVQYRILPAPREYGPLADFSCGKGGKQAEREINRTIAQLFGGRCPMQMLLVLLEKASGTDEYGRPWLIGVCGLTRLPSAPIAGLREGPPEVAYIPATGTDAIYRDHVLEDGMTRCSNALLESALKVTITMFSGEIPAVYAKVLPHNRGSMRLLREHGFDNLGTQDGENNMFRPPDLDPEFRR